MLDCGRLTSAPMVAMKDILELSDRIVSEFDPEKIILFGSHAYGTPGEHSDVDLLLIMPFEGSTFQQSLEVEERLEPPFYVDFIVRAPEDAERRYREGDPLIREAFDRGKVLYERSCS